MFDLGEADGLDCRPNSEDVRRHHPGVDQPRQAISRSGCNLGVLTRCGNLGARLVRPRPPYLVCTATAAGWICLDQTLPPRKATDVRSHKLVGLKPCEVPSVKYLTLLYLFFSSQACQGQSAGLYPDRHTTTPTPRTLHGGCNADYCLLVQQ